MDRKVRKTRNSTLRIVITTLRCFTLGVMQLLIKAKLLDLKGYFERFFSGCALLSEIKEIEGMRGVEEFLNNYRMFLEI